MDDKTLRDNVLAEMDHDPAIDPAEIAITVHDGVVTLRGHVATLAQKHAAAEAAARIKGVRGIAQEIVVRRRRDPHSDETLAGHAVARLGSAAVLANEAVLVEVEDGRVTLTGEVTWDYQRRIAEQEVRALDGVLDVTNQITLKDVTPEADIRSRIVAALARSVMDASDVSVLVEGADVTLAGTVQNWFDADFAERQAWFVPGVRSVDNRLVIVDDSHAIDLVA
jgi:osmotically-inducible protein OsmY